MGWNTVAPARRPHPLLAAAFAAMQEAPGDAAQAPPRKGRSTLIGHQPARPASDAAGVPFYFVHSYHAVPEEPFLVEATARYAGLAVTAAVGAANVFAVQFHPEKSQRAGLALLAAFASSSWS